MITPSSLDLATLPSLCLSRRSELPETPAIYFAIDSLDQTTPEIADWYVFRSGPKGPYTKLQLWEVQKITARTKVR